MLSIVCLARVVTYYQVTSFRDSSIRNIHISTVSVLGRRVWRCLRSKLKTVLIIEVRGRDIRMQNSTVALIWTDFKDKQLNQFCLHSRKNWNTEGDVTFKRKCKKNWRKEEIISIYFMYIFSHVYKIMVN